MGNSFSFVIFFKISLFLFRHLYYFLFTYLLIIMCMSILPICMSVYHVSVQPPDSLELELHLIVNYMRVLEIEPRSSGRAESTINLWAISPAP